MIGFGNHEWRSPHFSKKDRTLCQHCEQSELHLHFELTKVN